MNEASESKRDQAARMLNNILGTTPYYHPDLTRLLIDMIVDAAKEEIRAERAEERWHDPTPAPDGPSCEPPW